MDYHRLDHVPPEVAAILACPRCHAGLRRDGDEFGCRRDDCGFVGRVVDGMVSLLTGDGAAFFDERFRVMMHGFDDRGSYLAFYAQQREAARDRLAGARVVLDVGCGPRCVYERPPGSTLVGIDSSYESLRQNKDMDTRIFGSATALPLCVESVDAIVCFYSLHHFVGRSSADNKALLRAGFREFARVLAPRGRLLVFDIAPWWPVWMLQRAGWNVLRWLACDVMAMFFWHRRVLTSIARECLPLDAEFEYQTFRMPAWTTFPPMFAVQRLRLPRLLYPFAICMYHWRLKPPER